jgi:hypothetical protein
MLASVQHHHVRVLSLFLCLSLSVLGKVLSAVGSAQLLMSQKFQQFRGLCEQNLVSDSSSSTGAQPVLGRSPELREPLVASDIYTEEVLPPHGTVKMVALHTILHTGRAGAVLQIIEPGIKYMIIMSVGPGLLIYLVQSISKRLLQ